MGSQKSECVPSGVVLDLTVATSGFDCDGLTPFKRAHPFLIR